MDVTVISAGELDAGLQAEWHGLREANPDLASPYFAPRFTQAVAAERAVEIAIIRTGRGEVAFLPFQRSERSVAGPVGGLLSDYHGLIGARGFACDPRELLKRCGLVAWEFDHLLASQESFRPFFWHCESSPRIDVSAGYAAYVAERRAAGSEQIKKLGKLMRQMERELGPIRFVADSVDASMWEDTRVWKSRQYQATGVRDVLAGGWTRGVVERLRASRDDGCAGVLSLLFAGDRLTAGHFGLRARTVWHYWFPAYDPRLAKYSPGLILLLKMAEHAASLGIQAIDLGRGNSPYKQRLMNQEVMLAAGCVEVPSLRSVRRAALRTLRSIVANSPFAGPARRLMRGLRALGGGDQQ